METTLGVLTYNLLSMKYVLIIAYLLVALLAIAIKTNVHGFAVCDFMVAQVSATQNWLRWYLTIRNQLVLQHIKIGNNIHTKSYQVYARKVFKKPQLSLFSKIFS